MIQVYSEIGKLKSVLLHRPGNELKQIHPLKLQEMLFEMPPQPAFAQKEHDAFADILRSKGIEVLYLRNLFTEAVTNTEVRNAFIDEFAAISDIPSAALTEKVKQYSQKPCPWRISWSQFSVASEKITLLLQAAGVCLSRLIFQIFSW